MNKFFEKVPWGIVAGLCGILMFYLTATIIGTQFVFTQVNGQTGQIATIFDTWWQTLIFVLDIIVAIGFAGALTMFVRKKMQSKQARRTKS